MSQQKTIIDAMYDPDLFGPWHTPRKNWLRWEIVHRANYGLPIEAKDRAFYHKLFGPRRLPTAPATEGMAIAPRGSGKTQELAMEAVYASMLARLAIDSGSIPRRKVRGLLLSADREQTQESMDFCHMFTTESPLLRSLVTERTKTSVSFGPYVKLSVRTASDRSIRGPSAYFVGCDELPAWLPERAYKILRAVRPAAAKYPGSVIRHIGTTGEKNGPAFDMYEQFWGKDASVLVCVASGSDLNVTPSHKLAVARAYELDPYSASAEYGSQWLSGESAYITRENLHVMSGDRHPQPPADRSPIWIGLDMAAGGHDQHAKAAAWIVGGNRIRVGLIEHRAGRMDPAQVVAEFASILKPYRHRVVSITSDLYSGSWMPSMFRKAGLRIDGPHRRPRIAGGGRMSASDYYISLLGRLRQVDWPDHPVLLQELTQLVRTPNGVDHPAGTGKRDDLANAAARAVYGAAAWLDRQEADNEPVEAMTTEDLDEEERREWQRRPRGMLFDGDEHLLDERDGGKPLTALQERIARSIGNVYDMDHEVHGYSNMAMHGSWA